MTASAPGKLILIGEYAVLEGAPALVAAVNRRAVAEIVPAPGGIVVHAPDIDTDARGHWRSDGRIVWQADPQSAERLSLVTHVLESFAHPASAGSRESVVALERAERLTSARGRQDFCVEITLSTAEFFDRSEGSHHTKLGLGSSAALTVALAGALADHLGQASPSLAELIEVHRSFQGGRGSGADIAAALSGGLIAYTNQGEPAADATSLPPGVIWSVIFTGRSASTAAMLGALGTWRAHHPGRYAIAAGRLTELAEHAAALCTPASQARPAPNPSAAEDFRLTVDAYADALDALGAAANLDIMSADHRRLRNLARAHGVIYKPSGAGGGDIGIAFARDTDHSARFQTAVLAAGYRMMDMAIDPDGLIAGGRTSRHPDREGR